MLLRFGILLVRPLPRIWAIQLGCIVGNLAGRILIKEKKRLIQNLDFAYGNTLDLISKNKIAQGVFENYGRNSLEWIVQDKEVKKNWKTFVEIQGIDFLNQALGKGHGAIMTTGHFGNWELLAAVIMSGSYTGAVVAQRIYFEPFNQILIKLRQKSKVETVYRDDSPKKLIRLLKDNGIIGVLPDQDVDSLSGVFVKFFGHETYTPSGPAVLARLTGAPLIPCFMIRDGYKHKLFIENPIYVRENGEEHDICDAMQIWSSILERYIRLYPEQWVWTHRRWKTRPLKST